MSGRRPRVGPRWLWRLPKGAGNRSRFVGRRTDLYGPLVEVHEPEGYYDDGGRRAILYENAARLLDENATTR